MKPDDVQRFIIAAAALASIGCDHTNHVLTSPTPTVAPPVAAEPAGPLDGVYRLTFTSAPSCQLPDDAVRRTYTATIRTAGGRAVATLTGAQFWTDTYCGVMNSFDVYVFGNTVSFSNYAGDCGIIEQLSNTRYLKLWGSAKANVTDPISAPFDALVAVIIPDGSNGSTPIATCTASDHQLVFERRAP
jgi:hypothetical protein